MSWRQTNYFIWSRQIRTKWVVWIRGSKRDGLRTYLRVPFNLQNKRNKSHPKKRCQFLSSHRSRSLTDTQTTDDDHEWRDSNSKYSCGQQIVIHCSPQPRSQRQGRLLCSTSSIVYNQQFPCKTLDFVSKDKCRLRCRHFWKPWSWSSNQTLVLQRIHCCCFGTWSARHGVWAIRCSVLVSAAKENLWTNTHWRTVLSCKCVANIFLNLGNLDRQAANSLQHVSSHTHACTREFLFGNPVPPTFRSALRGCELSSWYLPLSLEPHYQRMSSKILFP